MEQTENKKKETAGKPENTRPAGTGEPEVKSEKAREKPAEESVSAKTPEKKAPEEETPEAALKKKLREAEDGLAKQKDQLLRTAAEYDNYRKRTEREKTMIYTDATAEAVQGFLPVADNLARALEQENCGSDDLRKGIEMVRKQMDDAFAKLGVTAFGREGDAFDPERYNAVSHVEDKKAGENVVTKVFQKVYKIGDRIFLHAMVQVAN